MTVANLGERVGGDSEVGGRPGRALRLSGGAMVEVRAAATERWGMAGAVRRLPGGWMVAVWAAATKRSLSVGPFIGLAGPIWRRPWGGDEGSHSGRGRIVAARPKQLVLFCLIRWRHVLRLGAGMGKGPTPVLGFGLEGVTGGGPSVPPPQLPPRRAA